MSDLLAVLYVCVQEVVAHWIAECRLAIDQTRLLTLHAAHALDTLGSRRARKQVTHAHLISRTNRLIVSLTVM